MQIVTKEHHGSFLAKLGFIDQTILQDVVGEDAVFQLCKSFCLDFEAAQAQDGNTFTRKALIHWLTGTDNVRFQTIAEKVFYDMKKELHDTQLEILNLV